MSEMTREQVYAKIRAAVESWGTPQYAQHVNSVMAHDALQRQRMAQLEARVAKLERRLEISFCFDADGNEQEIPPERRDAFPDGISARDETIRLLEAEVARLNEQITYLQTISTEQVARIRALEPKAWTDQKPTVPGWYWFKCDETWCQYDPRIVEIIEYPGEPAKYWTVRGAGINWSLGNLPGQWSGPIEKPKGEPS